MGKRLYDVTSTTFLKLLEILTKESDDCGPSTVHIIFISIQFL